MEDNQIEKLRERLDSEADSSGYTLNPDISFTGNLIEGLLINQKRYGYLACPCRLASGTKENDLDIICPCDYRDADLDQYGVCYCALYIDEDIKSGKKKIKAIPDRRYNDKEDKNRKANMEKTFDLKYPVLRCKVCGYLCARENPPARCPICKAERERFEIFIGK